MELNHVELKTGVWCYDREVQISFPSHWTVSTLPVQAMPTLEQSKIVEELENPASGVKLHGLLSPNKKIAIVIDDHTRPTPVADILIPLIEMLKRSSVPIRNIKIIISIGTHKLEKKHLLANKLKGISDLGIEIIVPDCRKSKELSFIGVSKAGIPVYINKNYAEADIRIAISGIYPHDEAGFSGGAKILIGILGLRTLSLFHRKHGLVQRGATIETAFRDEIEHFADLARIDYSINCVLNFDLKIARIFCGNFREAFFVASSHARACLSTEIIPEADVVIANAYPLDNSFSVLGKSTWPFKYCKKNAFKIVVTSLCGQPGDRIPFHSNARERLVQGFKIRTGLSWTKRNLIEVKERLHSMLKVQYKWEKPYLVHIPFIDSQQKKKPQMINGCHIEYDWDAIVTELLKMMGLTYNARVAIFKYTPMTFPLLNDET